MFHKYLFIRQCYALIKHVSGNFRVPRAFNLAQSTASLSPCSKHTFRMVHRLQNLSWIRMVAILLFKEVSERYTILFEQESTMWFKIERFMQDTLSHYGHILGNNLMLLWQILDHFPDNKVHGANMGPTWVLSAPDGPQVGPMNLAICVLVKDISGASYINMVWL